MIAASHTAHPDPPSQKRAIQTQIYNDVISPLQIALTGGLISLQLLLSQFPKRTLVAINLVLSFAIYLSHKHKFKNAQPTSWVFRAGVTLMAFNLLVSLFQRSTIEGMLPSLLTTINETCVLLSLVLIYRASERSALRNFLATFCYVVIGFTVANLVADKLNFGFESLISRSENFESRFNQGDSRWQSPLYSSAQLSGLLRIAFPLCFIFFLQGIKQRRFDLLWSLSLLVGTWAQMKIEFRAAALPFIYISAWLLTPNNHLRNKLLIFAIFYPFLAPFLFTSTAFESLLINYIPEYAPSFLGQQLTELVSLSSRTEIWRQALEALFKGKHFFIGEGHYLLDCTDDVQVDILVSSDLFRRVGFHQGALDIYFIYGTILATTLCAIFIWIVLRGNREYSNSLTNRLSHSDNHIAFITLAIVGIANSHDGFFIEHNYLYLVTIAALDTIWRFSDLSRRS